MLSFLIRKLYHGIAILISVTVVVFFLFNGLGDPARLTVGQRTDVATVEAVKKELGLDQPLHIQFGMYLNDVLPLSIHDNTPDNAAKYNYLPILPLGNHVLVLKTPYLRRSYQTKREVTDILLAALPKTLVLGLTAMTFAALLGIALGVLAAMNPFSRLDNSILVTATLGISQPSYFSGILLALIFGYWAARLYGSKLYRWFV
jgi:peptide/nickel transport system permease protein